MIFRKAEKEDFYKIRSLYWNLIDQEKDDPSFPQWKKGIHPSDEMIQNSIDREELYVLADGDEIAACVIANDFVCPPLSVVVNHSFVYIPLC